MALPLHKTSHEFHGAWRLRLTSRSRLDSPSRQGPCRPSPPNRSRPSLDSDNRRRPTANSRRGKDDHRSNPTTPRSSRFDNSRRGSASCNDKRRPRDSMTYKPHRAGTWSSRNKEQASDHSRPRMTVSPRSSRDGDVRMRHKLERRNSQLARPIRAGSNRSCEQLLLPRRPSRWCPAQRERKRKKA